MSICDSFGSGVNPPLLESSELTPQLRPDLAKRNNFHQNWFQFGIEPGILCWDSIVVRGAPVG